MIEVSKLGQARIAVPERDREGPSTVAMLPDYKLKVKVRKHARNPRAFAQAKAVDGGWLLTQRARSPVLVDFGYMRFRRWSASPFCCVRC